MKYTVNWFRFPNGKETDEMISNSRTYATFDQALRFLQGRVRLISSRHWAGGYIEEDDSPCRTVYEIDWEGNEEDLRCENATEREQNEVIASKSEQEEIPEDVKNMIENMANGIMNSLYQIASALMPVFSAIYKMYKTEENPEDIRPPPSTA